MTCQPFFVIYAIIISGKCQKNELPQIIDAKIAKFLQYLHL